MTGLGFKPSMVQFFPLSDNSAGAHFGMGVMTEDFQATVATSSTTAPSATKTSKTDACLVLSSSGGGGATFFRIVRVSIDSDGFTINVTQATSSVPEVAWMAFP